MFKNLYENAILLSDKVNQNRGRVAIFIDGSNLFYSLQKLGIQLDYIKLLCWLIADSRLLRSFFYTGLDPMNQKQQGFLRWMRHHGYRVIPKDVVQLPSGLKKHLTVQSLTTSKH